MLVIYCYYYCYILIIITTTTTCTVLGFISYFIYLKIKAVIPFDWVCVSAGYTSVPEQISFGCLYSQQGARQYGQWSLIKVYFSSKSPSFSHKNVILHNTDYIDEISAPVRASGHHLDNVSNIHTYTIKLAVSWDPFHDCSRSEASSFKQSQRHIEKASQWLWDIEKASQWLWDPFVSAALCSCNFLPVSRELTTFHQ